MNQIRKLIIIIQIKNSVNFGQKIEMKGLHLKKLLKNLKTMMNLI